jgi:hypothetical protein
VSEEKPYEVRHYPEEAMYEVEEYLPYEFEVEKKPGEHVRVRSRRVEEWGEEESESELPILTYAPYQEFILPVSVLAGTGSALTGLGIAQELFNGVAQMLQKILPFLTAKVSILSIPIPIVSIIGVGLIGFSLFLIAKTREVVIKL